MLRESLNFVDGYVTIHVSSYDEDVFFFSNALEINASHSMTLYFLVSQVSDLLLCMVKQSHSARRIADRYEIFERGDGVGCPLPYLSNSSKDFGDLFERAAMHQFAFNLRLLLILTWGELTLLLNFSFRNLLEWTLIFVNYFQDIQLGIILVASIA